MVDLHSDVTRTLNVCFCKKDTTITCSEDDEFNVPIGKIRVHDLVKSKKWRVKVTGPELETTGWAWAVFDLKWYSDKECVTEIPMTNTTYRSSNNDTEGFGIVDTNLGPVGYAFDDSTDTFFQTTCGRHTTNTAVQQYVPNKCAATVTTNCTANTINENRDNACQTTPYIEAQWTEAQMVKCVQILQVPTGGARRVNNLTVEWSHPSATTEEWVNLKTKIDGEADTGMWQLTDLQ